MATVKIYLPHLSGYITGPNTLTLKLTKTSDASAVNGAGDALTETGTSGWFSATVLRRGMKCWGPLLLIKTDYAHTLVNLTLAQQL